MPQPPVPPGRRQVVHRYPVDAARRTEFVVSNGVPTTSRGRAPIVPGRFPSSSARYRPRPAPRTVMASSSSRAGCGRCSRTTATGAIRRKRRRSRRGCSVDSREGLLKGGESGPALVAGQPEQSRLIEAVQVLEPGPADATQGPVVGRAGGRPRAVGRDRSPMAGQATCGRPPRRADPPSNRGARRIGPGSP